MKPRIPTAVLGATGLVGQRFVELLDGHPLFELVEVAASKRSSGRAYGEIVRWRGDAPVPAGTAGLRVVPISAVEAPLVFSALDADVARSVETQLADRGRTVVTNASAHRLDANVPLVVAEVNPDHLELGVRSNGGRLIANPNCSTIGLALALAPLARTFGLARVHVVTMQAVSGAGLDGPTCHELLDNVLPHIPGEEEKIEAELPKILGRLDGPRVAPALVAVSAQTNRVAVLDGHLACVSVELERSPDAEKVRAAWESFTGEPQQRSLPSAPTRPVIYLDDPDAPQPRRHRDLERGMATVIGRLQPCSVLDWKFVCLSHNTRRGAAGGALLLAELLVARGQL